MQQRLYRLSAWLPVLLLLVGWHYAAQSDWLSARVLPAPLAVLKVFVALAASGELLVHLQASAARALAGLVIGGGLGFLLGVLTGVWRPAELLLDSSVQMLRNIPPLAMTPLVILWFGIDETAKVFIVAIGTFFPLYLNTFHGIRSVDRALVEMARSYGVRGVNLYWQVILPGALPNILVGLRFALGFMWVLLIVAETLAAPSGIGYLTMNAREFMQTDVVLVGILLYALLGKLADVLASLLERHFLRWQSPGALKGGAA